MEMDEGVALACSRQKSTLLYCNGDGNRKRLLLERARLSVDGENILTVMM